jgi:hypothetical protein
VSPLYAMSQTAETIQPPRATAGRGLLELLLKAVEFQDLIARIERLENATSTNGDDLES